MAGVRVSATIGRAFIIPESLRSLLYERKQRLEIQFITGLDDPQFVLVLLSKAATQSREDQFAAKEFLRRRFELLRSLRCESPGVDLSASASLPKNIDPPVDVLFN